ncbi:orotidine 5'-phosphate decarboxylase [Candidatus Bathyarchaeota archaeon]|nr:orotidine 5'-phosphate decarboxylase [Candidatus Bathyarchaeota archaeon]
MSPFKFIMEESERRKGSRIVLALDVIDEHKNLLAKAMGILGDAYEHICALKINHHLVLPLGVFDGVKKILDKAHDLGLPSIMDCKANDIGHTNRVIAENYYKAGFDAIIANPFVGWEEGLQPIFEVAKKMSRGVILLTYMSHKAAWEGYGQMVYDAASGEASPQYLIFAKKALLWGADGVIAGATYPEKIREIYAVLRGIVPIYSPGIGMQGGDIEMALSAGAHYLIIGRSIIDAKDPAETAKRIKNSINKVLSERLGSRP